MTSLPKRPIAFIDSGIGGLSILNALAHSLSADEIIYFADAAHLPYGQKKYDFLLERATVISRFLQSQNVSTVYVACHTLSSTVLSELQGLFPEITYIDCLPPTITAVLQKSHLKKIGVMATQATIKGGTHKKLLQMVDPACTVIEQSCPLFVDLIEQQASREKLSAAIKLYLEPFVKADVDTIILGCTHYWFIKDLLESLAPTITFISASTALQKPSQNVTHPTIRLITTASLGYLNQACNRYFEHKNCCKVVMEAVSI